MTGEREQYRGWNVPLPATLRKYGGSVADWKVIVDRQGGKCPICGTVPRTGRGVIDHEHVAGWVKMSDALRWAHVRGVTCWWDNKFMLGRGVTAMNAAAVARYLRAYAKRRDSG